MNKNLSIVMAASLFTGICLSRAGETDAAPTSAQKIKIPLAGDSTVADRTGWGLGFKAFLDASIRTKSDRDRGGYLHNLSYLNLRMTNVGWPT